MKNKKLVFLGAAAVLIGSFFLAINIFENMEKNRLGFLAEENAELFIRDYSPQYGAKDAKVFITEFLDPECESCRNFYPKVKAILKKYEGKVKLVVRFAAFHKNSVHAIHVLEATRKQGKFWESMELLFKYQPAWADHHNPRPELVFDYLPEVGVDIVKLKEDMKDPNIIKMIEQEFKDLRELNVRGTPTFFVNGKPLEKFGMQYLENAIEAEIKIQY